MTDSKKLPNFAKIRERIEKGQTKREEVKAYRELAAWKTLNVSNPWEMALPGSHSGYSEEADVFIVLCVSEKKRIESRLYCLVGINGLVFVEPSG